MRYAILLDGGFVINKLKAGNELPEHAAITGKLDQIKHHEFLRGHELLRTYFYHAPPASDNLQNPISGEHVNLSGSTVYRYHESLIQFLETQPDMAVRLGEVSVHGWKVGGRALRRILEQPREIAAQDLVPDIKQKGVDSRVALDISRLALRGVVDILVVVTGDSDFIPAFKFARREGLRIYLDHMNHGVTRELKVHADRILDFPTPSTIAMNAS